ncbi:S-layer homology domain-containing protein [Bacillus sp. 1P06AnD]|uniref:S-layer homology domain-containing protein n=1 Tax=Bacillus sp. 1P06AnD TaxID=3132208 RepID=UPI0039A1341A
MKNKKVFLSSLALAISVPAVVSPVMASANFKDVSKSSYAYNAITELSAKKIIQGYEGGLFKPNEIVTRGQFASFLARALELPASDSAFKDLPKSKSLYADVSRAAAAGIVLGDKNGNVFPDKPVTRADVAVMVDRALQLKGDYTKQAILAFKDKGNIPNYAIESVKRMVYYGIIAGQSNNTFGALEKADRAQSSVFTYRMLQLIENGSVTPPVVTPPTTPETPSKPDNGNTVKPASLKGYTYAQLKKEVGTWEIIQRSGGDGSITVIDAVEEMYYDIKKLDDDAPALKLSPKEFFKSYKDLLYEGATYYNQAYPKFEYTAINGIPYRQSEFYPEFLKNPKWVDDITLNNVIPNPSTEQGKFLIDLPTLNKDVVTYEDKKVQIERMDLMVKKSGTEYLVDIAKLFHDTNYVKVTNGGYSISFNGQTLTLNKDSVNASLDGKAVILKTKIQVNNGVVMVPFKSICDALGISWREMDFGQRLELANYPLERGIFGWEE